MELTRNNLFDIILQALAATNPSMAFKLAKAFKERDVKILNGDSDFMGFGDDNLQGTFGTPENPGGFMKMELEDNQSVSFNLVQILGELTEERKGAGLAFLLDPLSQEYAGSRPGDFNQAEFMGAYNQLILRGAKGELTNEDVEYVMAAVPEQWNDEMAEIMPEIRSAFRFENIDTEALNNADKEFKGWASEEGHGKDTWVETAKAYIRKFNGTANARTAEKLFDMVEAYEAVQNLMDREPLTAEDLAVLRENLTVLTGPHGMSECLRKLSAAAGFAENADPAMKIMAFMVGNAEKINAEFEEIRIREYNRNVDARIAEEVNLGRMTSDYNRAFQVFVQEMELAGMDVNPADFQTATAELEDRIEKLKAALTGRKDSIKTLDEEFSKKEKALGSQLVEVGNTVFKIKSEASILEKEKAALAEKFAAVTARYRRYAVNEAVSMDEIETEMELEKQYKELEAQIKAKDKELQAKEHEKAVLLKENKEKLDQAEQLKLAHEEALKKAKAEVEALQNDAAASEEKIEKISRFNLKRRELQAKSGELLGRITSYRLMCDVRAISDKRMAAASKKADGFIERLADKSEGHNNTNEFTRMADALRDVRNAQNIEELKAKAEALKVQTQAYLDAKGTQWVPKMFETPLRHTRLNMAHEMLAWSAAVAAMDATALKSMNAEQKTVENNLLNLDFDTVKNVDNIELPKAQAKVLAGHQVQAGGEQPVAMS